VGTPLTPWYGIDAAWWVPLERDARRTFGDALRHTLTHSQLAYQLDDVDVPGDLQPRNIRITSTQSRPTPPTPSGPRTSPRACHPAGAVQAPLPR
jgi:hypothetical protein